MPLLSGVLLRDLQLDDLARSRHCPEERRGGLAHLKINRTVFDLDDDSVFKLSVERTEVVVRGPGAVGFWIAPIQVMVVNESAVEENSVMRTQSTSNDIGCVCGGAAILRWPGAAFGICFDDKAAEVRNALVNSVGGCFPPGGHIRIERIECLQSCDCHWAAQIH